MTKHNLTTARILHYKPRDTHYRVLHHNVKIKSDNSSWKLGCVYVSAFTTDTQLYTRPYDMFDDRWEAYTIEDSSKCGNVNGTDFLRKNLFSFFRHL